MLTLLHLKNLGPATELEMSIAPRLNIIAGDNGLGKTLLLDAAWWALTQTWPITWGGKGITPVQEPASIRWREQRGSAHGDWEESYSYPDSRWPLMVKAPSLTFWDKRGGTGVDGAIVLYLRVDGGISVFDPLRFGERIVAPFAYDMRGDERSHVFQFRDRDIWDGLELGADKVVRVCEGLVRDVSHWAGQAGNESFEQLAAVVEQLAGPERYRLTRKFGRVYVDDSRDYSVLAGPTGEISVAHAPAGLRRILGLAYIAVWAWREHRAAAELKKLQPSTSLIVLMDEVESHLHPKWQRTILPSILRTLGAGASLQMLATTHSPMVLASVEPVFDEEIDKLFVLDQIDGCVQIDDRMWAKQGDVINWLVSDTFGLQQARSVEAERAIEAAEAWMRGDTAKLPPDLATKEAIHADLLRLLPGHDDFWPCWIVTTEQRGMRL